MLNELGKTLLQQIAACHDYISSEELSKICNVSINTIRKEIDLINDYLRGPWLLHRHQDCLRLLLNDGPARNGTAFSADLKDSPVSLLELL